MAERQVSKWGPQTPHVQPSVTWELVRKHIPGLPLDSQESESLVSLGIAIFLFLSLPFRGNSHVCSSLLTCPSVNTCKGPGGRCHCKKWTRCGRGGAARPGRGTFKCKTKPAQKSLTPLSSKGPIVYFHQNCQTFHKKIQTKQAKKSKDTGP